MKYLLYVFLTLLSITAVIANPGVYDLTPANFDKVVRQSNYTSFVMFYAPWCGHCKNLEPIYLRMATFLHREGKYAVNVARVDCAKETNRALCQKHGVESYPTLKVFRPPKYQPGKVSKAGHVPEVYKGQRTLKAMLDFVTSRIKNYVKRVHNLKSSGLPEWLSRGNNLPKVLLLTTANDATPLYKTMAIDFLGSLSFGAISLKKIEGVPSVELDGENVEIPVKEGDALPILLVYQPSTKTFERYSGGKLKQKEKLEKWIMEVTGAVPGEGSLAKKKKERAPKHKGGKRKFAKDEL